MFDTKVSRRFVVISFKSSEGIVSVVRLNRRHQRLDHVLCDPIVTVDKQDILTGRMFQAFISASAETRIYFLLNVADTAITQHRAFYDCRTIVG
ncbi:hypothetical protein ATCR1_11723 [Agrobacterium tumefaciens CCNWGS0286]|nr:hypothetical protein ATCR1_11723 [Agrobacterium tumefaciens CCNWGS0286]